MVVIVNGDFGGRSAWTTERGWVGVQFLSALAQEQTVLYTLGNHDGFDWGRSENGNRLVLQQMRVLSQAGVKILGANVEFSREARPFVADQYDLVTQSGRRMRFVGLGLEDFFSKSNWDISSSTPVLSAMRPPVMTMERETRRAISSQIQDLIFFQHDGHHSVASSIETLQRTLRQELSQSGLRLPVAFASHDHLSYQGQHGQTLIVDSRSNFDFSTVEITATGGIAQARFFDEATQKQYSNRPIRSERLRAVASGVESFVSDIRSRASVTLGQTEGFDFTKRDLNQSRNDLGNALAESLRMWGVDQISQRSGELTGGPVVALYNSSSYRNDRPIPQGPLSIGDIAGFYPFGGHIALFEVSGRELLSIFAAIRRYGQAEANVYTPQMTRNLVENSGFNLRIDLGSGFHPINQTDLYHLVLDSWLARNGYKISEIDQLLQTRQPIASEEHQEVFRRFIPEAFVRPLSYRSARSCRELFIPASQPLTSH